MPKSNEYDGHKEHPSENGVRLAFRVLIPIVLLGGGLTLLALRIAGWSIIFGLPMITFGVVFLVYTYDELVSNVVKPIPKNVVKCSVCRKDTTKLYPWVENKDAICLTCRDDIEKGIKKANKE